MATPPPPDDQASSEVGPCNATVVLLHRPLTLADLFTSSEVAVAERLQRYARDHAGEQGGELRGAMDLGFRGLAPLAEALRAYPSLRSAGTLGRRERSGASLMRKLLEAGANALEWSIPTKGVIARTFGIAKVNFWTAMRYAVQACDPNRDAGLEAAITAAIEEAVYTRLAEELYGSFVSSKSTDDAIRRAAINAAIDLWEGRVSFATDRFCPLLRSAWAARCSTPRVFGTLMGTSEIFNLLFADCDAAFVEHLTEEDDPERIQAFEEFLFDLPFESLARVRVRMREAQVDTVGPDEVAGYLGLSATGLRPLVNDPKALYTSFRTRRVKAQYRLSMGVPGPKRTAEAYVLETLLRKEIAAGPRDVEPAS